MENIILYKFLEHCSNLEANRKSIIESRTIALYSGGAPAIIVWYSYLVSQNNSYIPFFSRVVYILVLLLFILFSIVFYLNISGNIYAYPDFEVIDKNFKKAKEVLKKYTNEVNSEEINHRIINISLRRTIKENRKITNKRYERFNKLLKILFLIIILLTLESFNHAVKTMKNQELERKEKFEEREEEKMENKTNTTPNTTTEDIEKELEELEFDDTVCFYNESFDMLKILEDLKK